MARYAHIVGWGMAVPQRVVTNHELAQFVETSDEWIVTRTGIRERRVASPQESTATLSIAAAEEALAVAGIPPRDVDLILVATVTPEYLFPSTACLVQDALGATKAGAFDLLAGCSGFIYGLHLAAAAIRAGTHQVALVIGAETLSRIVNWQDRNTCVLFGDGAGAVVLQGSDTPGGVLASMIRADGSGGELLILPAGGSRLPISEAAVRDGCHFIRMNGREVFRFATRVMEKATREVIAQAGLRLEDVDLIIPHQANIRIIEAAAKALGLPMDRFFVNIDRYGNTSAASIPIALCEAVQQRRLNPGDRAVMVAFGAGLTWAAAVVEWGAPRARPRPLWLERLARITLYLPAQLHSRLMRLWRRLDAWFSRILRQEGE
ncbi:beta-ketoacyl-ACP synthase III [Thermoflexus sp.]|uniref:beta-ketoacyl-ACP synthase III n=1 Tax=Thermoflexus sp. TaxID=1969742 RepID=UPI0025FCA48A|nr:beta-ketoacyl-ACP synthase III [Thermoflexus sp.]MDW8180612.1 beta-ketoacyl-ACP synthase III [Anaerolineae bacterium]MDW8184815.1 beta-ketoacyl-ACP synthase III [Anaerolineae bacterium]